MRTRALVIREILISIRVAAAVVTVVCLSGCAPKRGEEISSSHSRTTQGAEAGRPAGAVGKAGAVGQVGKVPPVAETCVPENVGPLGIRVVGTPLIPNRALRTNDRTDWPMYAPPEIIRVTLPEMPSEPDPPALPTAEGANTAQKEGEDGGDRSPDGY
ncbi:MAG: hypothetical protein ACUVQK_14280 [Thermogutta sp.]